MHFVLTAVALFALWLLMSGLFKPLLIGFGVISVVLCCIIIARLSSLRGRSFWSQIKLPHMVRYMFWLTVEIGKADWAVTKVILSQPLNLRQRFIKVPARQYTDFGKMVFANSITITPGTVTIETEPDSFIVHALTDESADKAGLDRVNREVCALEAKGRG